MNSLDEAHQELHTLLDFIRWGISELTAAECYFGHGTDNAFDESLALALHAIHLSHDIDSTLLQSKITTSEKTRILALFKKRIEERIPLPYLTGKANFGGLSFHVNEHVLIPRSPMAEIIEQHFAPWSDPSQVHRILDLCTGSGCIAILCAHYFHEAAIDAIDISNEALTVADRNVNEHHCNEAIQLIESDLFDAIEPNEQYDVIISNPPYVDVNDFDTMPAEYNHEPKLALTAGTDGLLIVDKMLHQASAYLSKHGILIVEVGNSADALCDKYTNIPFTWLDFERGGDGVFVITKQELENYFSEETDNE